MEQRRIEDVVAQDGIYVGTTSVFFYSYLAVANLYSKIVNRIS